MQAAIDKYEQEGLEATVAYYSSRESIEGQWSLFLVDQDGLVAVFRCRARISGPQNREYSGSPAPDLKLVTK